MKHLPSVFLSLFLIINLAAQNDGWHISTLKTNNYTGIAVANGRIGILPSEKLFGVKQIILNNVYEKASELGVSRILEGMNFGNLEMQIDGEKISKFNISDWKQTLMLKEAGFKTTFKFKDKAEISYTIYALRHVPYSGYIDVSIKPLKPIEVKVSTAIELHENLKTPKSTFRVLRDAETTMPILQTVAKSKFGKHTVATSGTFIWHNIHTGYENERPELVHKLTSENKNALSFTERLQSNQNLNFAWTAAQCTTQDFNDPQTESERFIIFNLLTPKDDLLGEHKALWAELWESDIIIEGELKVQQDVRLALYHLYAFSRADSDLSIAPMGLSSQNYNGHIFWDTELWMYPPLLLLNQDIAKSLLNYRLDRLGKAKQKAVNFGYKGAMFPWESDETGEEATPAWALTGTFEHHITADIAIAFWNYYKVTKDKKWLEQSGYPMLKEIADFWDSRSTKNKDGSYSIKNVVGANEFAPNVTDNAFTNAAAITALNYAIEASKVLEHPINENWKDVADNLRILKMDNGTTKEHANYDGEIIKQADVNLLAFPLNVVNEKAQIIKDLEYYEPKLSPEGPAMGKAIFAVIYARLGNAEEAYRLFKESYMPNKRPPFGALAESATSDNPYFVTGAGGMLQTILFGFGGLHITNQGIVQKNPILPKQWKSLTLKGIGPAKKTFKVN